MENSNISKVNVGMIIGKGIIIAFITTFILLFLFSILLTYTNLPEAAIAPTIIVASAISILIGSSLATLKIKKNGLINGGIIGGIYICTIYLISSILNTGFALNISSIIMILICIFAGILGGIVGVNIK